MRIGIDARFLTHPQPGGFKTYTASLIQALTQIDDVNQYVIYVDRASSESELPRAKNFSYQVVDGTVPVLGVPVREQLGLRRFIQRDQLDIVHFLCNTATVNLQHKTIVTLHDTIQVTSKQQFSLTARLAQYKSWAIESYSKWTILRTVKSVERLITVSNSEKTQIMQHLQIPTERIAVTHLAAGPVFVPASSDQKAAWKLELQQRFGLSLKGKLILGVGYEPRKNIPMLIEAFACLASDFPEWQLVVVAAEPNRRNAFQELIAKRHLSDRAVVLGQQSASDLAQLYNATDIFVFPSEYESFGLPPLEAMACGVPTIAMNSSSIPEIVEDGALLVDGKDPQTWANAIQRVATNSKFRSELVQRGLKRASEMTWQNCARETLQIYYEVFEGMRYAV